MASLVIKNGRVIDPASGHDAIADVWIEDGVVRGVGSNLGLSGAKAFDATGLMVAPGFTEVAYPGGAPCPANLCIRACSPICILSPITIRMRYCRSYP